MNWPKEIQKCKWLFGLLILWQMTGCGVKGDPLPPEKPAELGRGRPSYKRATEGIPLQKYKHEEEKDEQDEEQKDDDAQ